MLWAGGWLYNNKTCAFSSAHSSTSSRVTRARVTSRVMTCSCYRVINIRVIIYTRYRSKHGRDHAVIWRGSRKFLLMGTVCTSIQQAGYYSILADETKDMSKQEQLSIVIRYLDGNTHSIVEHFLTFVIASNLTVEHLSKYILDTLTLYNLDVNMIDCLSGV